MEKGEDRPPGSRQAEEHHLHQDQHHHPYMSQTGETAQVGGDIRKLNCHKISE
ncbi:hypothetical protein DPMN_171488 [Dreissena polymorpha]|uniref:Uncharacterized protein n=1 Tax=Dreissena polymorpha TaxID=45954 RepID=A0A9D4E196_DREPO|nr:hypothetical protein DPMN_171488 [Dreissena polymorpha]